jgi:hypothetical protein
MPADRDAPTPRELERRIDAHDGQLDRRVTVDRYEADQRATDGKFVALAGDIGEIRSDLKDVRDAKRWAARQTVLAIVAFIIAFCAPLIIALILRGH